jgi:hypothetical protein
MYGDLIEPCQQVQVPTMYFTLFGTYVETKKWRTVLGCFRPSQTEDQTAYLCLLVKTSLVARRIANTICVRFGLFASGTDTKINRSMPSVCFGRGLPHQFDVNFLQLSFIGNHNLHRLEKIEQPLETKTGRALGFILLFVVVVLHHVREVFVILFPK